MARADRHLSICSGRTGGTGGNSSASPGMVVLASPPLPEVVAIRGELHPAARRRVDEQHRKWVLRRLPVSLLNLEISGRDAPPGLSLADGADVPGAQGVVARWWQLAGMGNRWRLWSALGPWRVW